MPRRCALGCPPNTRGSLHVFPNPDKYPEKHKAWVKIVTGHSDCDFDYKNYRVCDRHFTATDRTRNSRLNVLAVPSLFLPDMVESMQPSQIPDIVDSPMRTDYQDPVTDSKMAPLLYKMDASPPANAVRVLADIIGLELDLKDINFANKEHKSPEYIKRNPMGTVPTLQDDDFVISDSHATIKYLLAKYGAHKSESLYPSDLRTRALVDQCLFFDTGIFFIRFKVVALPTALGELVAPTAKHLADIEEAYGVVEAYLGRNQYLAADHLTIADISVGATAVSMQPILKLDAAKFPRTSAWLSKLEKDASFKKILFPGAEILGKYLKACWEKLNK